MEILLEEFYKADIYIENFHYRKVQLDEKSYQINGISQSGKTKLIKNYLHTLKKNSYLYIDCKDVRIDIEELNDNLQKFCTKNKITLLVLDNYTPQIKLANVSQLIIASELYYEFDFLEYIILYPLDYEEFLAYEHKYDSSALNHFFQLGALPSMHKVYPDERSLYIQKTLQFALSSVEFDILCLCAKLMAQKLSAYTLYERLKGVRKISKDKLYQSFDLLTQKNYIHLLEKYNHPKAIKKIYLCDISLKSALTIEKHFGRLFENMIYLELLKAGIESYYDDGIDFYVPHANEIILGMPFSDERALFKKIEKIEAFLFTNQIKKITAITMSAEGAISHPLSKVEMLPFDIWAISD